MSITFFHVRFFRLVKIYLNRFPRLTIDTLPALAPKSINRVGWNNGPIKIVSNRLKKPFKKALLKKFLVLTRLLVIRTETRIGCRSICASIQNCDTFTWSNQDLKCLLKKHLNNRNQYGFDLGTLSSNLTLFLQKKPHFDTQAHNFTACSILIM